MRAAHLFGTDVRVSGGWVLAIPGTVTLLAGYAFPRWQPDWGPVIPWFTAIVMAIVAALSAALQGTAGLLYARSEEIALARVKLSPWGGVAIPEDSATRRDGVALALIGPATSLFVGLLTYFLFLLTAGDLMGDILGAAVARGSAEAMIDALQMLGPPATILLWCAIFNLALGLVALLPGVGPAGNLLIRRALTSA